MSLLGERREKGASARAAGGALALDLWGRECVVHDFAIQTSDVRIASGLAELSSGGDWRRAHLVAGHGRCPTLTKHRRRETQRPVGDYRAQSLFRLPRLSFSPRPVLALLL